MQITVFVLSTCVPNEPEPCWPDVFVTEAEANIAFAKALEREWETAGIEDDDGNKMPFPDDASYAQDQLVEHYTEHGTEVWGQYEITPHKITIDVPAVEILRRLRASNPEFDAGAMVDHADVTRRLADLWPDICSALASCEAL